MEQSRKLLFHIRNILFIFPLLMISCRANVFNVLCHKNTNYTQDTTPFQTNLESVFSLLNSASSTAHYQSTTVGSGPNKAYAAFMCRHGLPTTTCHDCVLNATSDLLAFCPNYWEASSLYRYCAVQYANQSIFSQTSNNIDFTLGCENPDFRDPLLKKTAQKTISNLINKMNISALTTRGNESNYYYATGEETYLMYQKVHGLVQCAPELSTLRCRECLKNGMNNVFEFCNTTLGGAAIGVGCSLTYSLYSFYNNTGSVLAPHPPPSLPPSSQSLPIGNSSPAYAPGNLSLVLFVLACFLRKFYP